MTPWTGHVGKSDRIGVTAKTGQQGKRAGNNNAEAGQLGQESLGRIARTRQPEMTVRMVLTGGPEHDSKDRTAKLGHTWQNSHGSKVGV